MTFVVPTYGSYGLPSSYAYGSYGPYAYGVYPAIVAPVGPSVACSPDGTCAVLGTGAGITQYSERYGVATDVLVPGFNAWTGRPDNVQVPVWPYVGYSNVW